MAILKVSRMGHPVLRQKAASLTADQLRHPRTQQLIDDMVETMLDYEGIGLAAPQVFQPLRLAVLGVPEAGPEEIPLTVVVNPDWLQRSAEQVDGFEGCLSIPELRGRVPRSARVGVRALDRQGRPFELQAGGLFARVLQHEIDHLDGILFLDRMKDLSTLAFLEEHRRYWARQEEEEE